MHNQTEIETLSDCLVFIIGHNVINQMPYSNTDHLACILMHLLTLLQMPRGIKSLKARTN